MFYVKEERFKMNFYRVDYLLKVTYRYPDSDVFYNLNHEYCIIVAEDEEDAARKFLSWVTEYCTRSHFIMERKLERQEYRKQYFDAPRGSHVFYELAQFSTFNVNRIDHHTGDASEDIVCPRDYNPYEYEVNRDAFDVFEVWENMRELDFYVPVMISLPVGENMIDEMRFHSLPEESCYRIMTAERGIRLADTIDYGIINACKPIDAKPNDASSFVYHIDGQVYVSENIPRAGRFNNYGYTAISYDDREDDVFYDERIWKSFYTCTERRALREQGKNIERIRISLLDE